MSDIGIRAELDRYLTHKHRNEQTGAEMVFYFHVYEGDLAMDVAVSADDAYFYRARGRRTVRETAEWMAKEIAGRAFTAHREKWAQPREEL